MGAEELTALILTHCADLAKGKLNSEQTRAKARMQPVQPCFAACSIPRFSLTPSTAGAGLYHFRASQLDENAAQGADGRHAAGGVWR
jgi:hypothetical protein